MSEENDEIFKANKPRMLMPSSFIIRRLANIENIYSTGAPSLSGGGASSSDNTGAPVL